MKRYQLVLVLMVLFVFTLRVYAQEVTPPVEPPVTESPTVTESLITPTPVETQPPVATETNTPTPDVEATLTETPLVEPTVVPELTAEVTPEIVSTPEQTLTPELVTPTVAPTATVEPGMTLLLHETFDTGATYWTLGEGMMLVPHEEGQALQISQYNGVAGLTIGALTNTTTEMRFQLTEGALELSLRRNGSDSYTVIVRSDNQIAVRRSGQIMRVASVPSVHPGQWRTLRVSALGGTINLNLDSMNVLEIQDTSPLSAGIMTLEGFGAGAHPILVDDFKVWLPIGELPATISTPTTNEIPASEDTLIDSIRQAAYAEFGGNPGAIYVSLADTKIFSNWAFSQILINYDTDMPTMILALVRMVDNEWKVAFEDSELYQRWFYETPDQLISAQIKAFYGGSNTRGDGSGQFRLPFRGTWSFTGGPHNDQGLGCTIQNGYAVPDLCREGRYWSSLDFAKYGGGDVFPANTGIAYTNTGCSGMLRIDHLNGWQSIYRHMSSIWVSNTQNITSYDTQLGVSGGLNCSGNAVFANHLHIAFMRGSSTGYVDIKNMDLGGWTIQEGTYQYSGCLIPVAGGNPVCTGGTITENGTIGSGVPDAPSSFVATAVSPAQINFTWSDNSSNESDFRIEYSMGDGNWHSFATIGANQTAFQMSNMSCSTTYHFRIRASGSGGTTFSNYANTVTVTTQKCVKPTAAPIILTPASATYTNDTTPDVTWKPIVNPSVRYEIQIDDVPTFTNPLIYSSVTGNNVTTQTISPALADKRYYLRIRATNLAGTSPWSATRIFYVDTIAPDAPLRATPVDGYVTTNSRQPLTWKKVTGAVRYIVDIAKDGAFTNLEVNGANVTTTSYTPTISLGQGLHYWQVRACDRAGNCGVVSTRGAYYINIQLSPADTGKVVTQTGKATPTFSWQAVTGAEGYRLIIYRNNTFLDSDILYSVDLGSNIRSHKLPSANALSHGIYYWRVGVVGVPPTSVVSRQFYITPPFPGAPILTSPSHGSITTDNTPIFSWKPVTYAYGPITYQVQIDESPMFTVPYTYLQTYLPTTTHTVATPLALGKHYWRIRVMNSVGVAGPWSATRIFTVTSSGGAGTGALASISP